MTFYLLMLIILVVAVLAAIVVVIVKLSVQRPGKGSKPSGNQKKNSGELDEAQAAVTASTWTSINPPSS